MSPVEVTFGEIGAIPPPRMFSDTNTITLSITSDSSDSQRNGFVNHMDVDAGDNEDTDGADSDAQSFQRDGPSVTVIRDDEPAKEPLDATAVPKKSALKKSKVSVTPLIQSNIPSNNTSVPTMNFSLPLPSDRYVFSFTPRPPASDNHFDSSADSDSDCEDSVKWRDYYGDDERGQFVSICIPCLTCLSTRSKECAHRAKG